MPKSKTQKTNDLKSLETNLDEANLIVLWGFNNLPFEGFQEIRSELDENAKIVVYKNTLLRIAFENKNWEKATELISNQTSLAFNFNDDISVLKALNKHKKASYKDGIEFYGAIFNGEILSAEEVNELANLPSFEDQLATLASMLNSPLVKFALLVKELATKADSGSTPSEEKVVEEKETLAQEENNEPANESSSEKEEDSKNE